MYYLAARSTEHLREYKHALSNQIKPLGGFNIALAVKQIGHVKKTLYH